MSKVNRHSQQVNQVGGIKPRPVSEHYRAKGCTGKRRYLDRSTAAAVAQRAFEHTGEITQPYQCAACGLWHVGHPPLDEKKGTQGTR